MTVRQLVLIESDWNLKLAVIASGQITSSVLIESDWDLKCIPVSNAPNIRPVLIESDWNLKFNVTVSNLPADEY